MFGKKATKVSVNKQIEIIAKFDALKETIEQIKVIQNPNLRDAALDCVYLRMNKLEAQVQELFKEDLLKMEKF